MTRQGRPNIRCHSEERSDEESREQNSQRNHTGSFAGAQDDSMFWDYSPIRNCCHSEERSDEESREQNSQRNHTGSFAGAQDDSIFWDPSLTPCRDCPFRACFATARVGCGRQRQGCSDGRLVKSCGTAFGPLPLRFAQHLPLRGRHTDSFCLTQDIFSPEIPVFRPLFLRETGL